MYNKAKIKGVNLPEPTKRTKIEIIQACYTKYGYHVESLHQRFLKTETEQFFENSIYYYCFTVVDGIKTEIRFWKHSRRYSEVVDVDNQSMNKLIQTV